MSQPTQPTKASALNNPISKRIIRMPAVQERTGLSRSGLFEKLNPASPRWDKNFPTRIKLGSRAIGFLESEIDEWILSCAKNNRVAK